MRMKCVAEESINAENIERNVENIPIIRIIEDEKVLILSTEEGILLNQQNIDNDIYYDAKKSFLLNGEIELSENLRYSNLSDEQQRILFDFIVDKN